MSVQAEISRLKKKGAKRNKIQGLEKGIQQRKVRRNEINSSLGRTSTRALRMLEGGTEEDEKAWVQVPDSDLVQKIALTDQEEDELLDQTYETTKTFAKVSGEWDELVRITRKLPMRKTYKQIDNDDSLPWSILKYGSNRTFQLKNEETGDIDLVNFSPYFPAKFKKSRAKAVDRVLSGQKADSDEEANPRPRPQWRRPTRRASE